MFAVDVGGAALAACRETDPSAPSCLPPLPFTEHNFMQAPCSSAPPPPRELAGTEGEEGGRANGGRSFPRLPILSGAKPRAGSLRPTARQLPPCARSRRPWAFRAGGGGPPSDGIHLPCKGLGLVLTARRKEIVFASYHLPLGSQS